MKFSTPSLLSSRPRFLKKTNNLKFLFPILNPILFENQKNTFYQMLHYFSTQLAKHTSLRRSI